MSRETPDGTSGGGFRWVKPAASLKRVCAATLIHYYECFRWVKPAASLKPYLWTRVSGPTVAVSAG